MLHETQIVIEEGVTIGGHSLREHLEATNHAEAFDFLRQLVERPTAVNSETILALHALVLKTIDPTAGQQGARNKISYSHKCPFRFMWECHTYGRVPNSI
jgi:Fic family protein